MPSRRLKLCLETAAEEQLLPTSPASGQVVSALTVCVLNDINNYNCMYTPQSVLEAFQLDKVPIDKKDNAKFQAGDQLPPPPTFLPWQDRPRPHLPNMAGGPGRAHGARQGARHQDLAAPHGRARAAPLLSSHPASRTRRSTPCHTLGNRPSTRESRRPASEPLLASV